MTWLNISIHATPTGRDPSLCRRARSRSCTFQFTRPTRAAIVFCRVTKNCYHFNSRDPTGRDFKSSHPNCCKSIFQFTRPLRAAIKTVAELCIPAPRFQFTRPLRAAMTENDIMRDVVLFQFTRPLRAAIMTEMERKLILGISIHATPTGRD